jgi:hypothetical protein
VKLLPSADYTSRQTFAHSLYLLDVILLPEGHLENDFHFQDRPAESGQKYHSEILIHSIRQI